MKSTADNAIEILEYCENAQYRVPHRVFPDEHIALMELRRQLREVRDAINKRQNEGVNYTLPERVQILNEQANERD
jgi:hypothetical protein